MFNNFKTNIKVIFASAIMAVAFSTQAQAGVINIGSDKVINPNHFESFDVGTMGVVTNQFVDNGLIFTTIAKGGITLTNNTNCNNSNSGFVSQYLFMGVNYPCSPATTVQNAVSIQFDNDVSELSWSGFSRTQSTGFTIQALYDGEVVSSTTFNGRNRFENKSVMFTGSVFNELRFVENGNYQGYFGIDNMAWNTIEPAEVPIPGTVALMGIGMLGFGAMRRKRKSA